MISKKNLNKIRNRLPKPYAQKILARIKKSEPSKRISITLIYSVMNGYKKDYHGIIDTAIDLIEEEKRRRKEEQDKYNQRIKTL
jgi:hypothetical protein